MSYYQKPTLLEETACAAAQTLFAEHLRQFKSECDDLHNLECNLGTLGNEAFKAALQSSGHVVQTDDGTKWQHGVKLTQNVSLCHRRAPAGLEFAIVECLPLKVREMNDILTSGHNVREVLAAFTRDQRQLLHVWKNDIKAQVGEHLDEKYPHQDLSRVVESFEIKLTRAITEKQTLAQSHGQGVRI